ncbi:MAG: xanthine dehydrogenase family protein molybdopterin-binding subunit [Thermomicrobiales bacterium]
MVYSKQMGARVKRKEDPRLITGSSTYVDDVRPQETGHVAILRSIYAHAKLNNIDTSKAEAHPGVIAVYTGAQFRDMLEPMPHGGEGGGPADMAPVATPVVAHGTVYHVGQAIAVVVATDRYIARDALDLIEVDYDPLPVVTDIEEAIKDGAPQLYDQVPNNIAYTWTRKKGDPDAAFANAEVTVSQRMNNQRVAGISLETRGVLAQPDALSGGLTVFTSTQNPHTVRQQIAATLGLAEIDVRVIAPEVGGGFGVKISSYPEDMICAVLARRLRRPIKWIETRSEHLLATHHGRAQIAEISLAAKRDGTVTALKFRGLADLGAYPRDPGIPPLTGLLLNGVYGFESVDMEIRAVYTNTMATGAYRGAGRPEAAYYLERIMDVLADELGMDPVEVRRKNFIPPDAFPYKTAAGPVYDSGDYNKALTKALELSHYQDLRAEQGRLRQQGRYRGIGVTTFTEICGFGPFDSASVRVEPTGKVTVATGISPHGQGQETTFAQIVADELGVSMDDVVVVHGDTARTPAGIGTMGSRGLVVGGSALMGGIGKVKDKAIKIAAHMLEASADDVTFSDGKFGVKGAPENAKTLTDIAKVAYSGSLPPEIGTGLEAVDFFAPPNTTFPFGADVVTVDVDPETGAIALRSYVAVDDCGRQVSPLLVDGQVHGGLTQGIAQALYEEIVYDEDGQLVTGSLMDYAAPKAEFLPMYQNDRTETPSPLNPLGAKGIGELATIGSTPAIVNAVVDALSPFGIRHLDMPLKPERVWQAIQNARGAQAAD